jgi:hypothetical protein
MGYGDGGKAWSISPDDFKAFEIGNTGMCVGAFFALDLGGGGGSGVPNWIVGDSFLVGYHFLIFFFIFVCWAVHPSSLFLFLFFLSDGNDDGDDLFSFPSSLRSTSTSSTCCVIPWVLA